MVWTFATYSGRHALTIVITYYVASFLQTLFHRLFGYHGVGGWRFRSQVEEHHVNYVKDRRTSERYIAEARNGTYMYLIPFSLVIAAAYLVLPLDLFLVHGAALAISFYAIAYVHVQYHVTGSWLNRFGCFRRRRALHFVHHRHMGTNFAVVDYFWDRLLGTFRGQGGSGAGAANKPPAQRT